MMMMMDSSLSAPAAMIKLRKTVRFSERIADTHWIEPISADDKRSVYYSKTALEKRLQQEYQKIEHFQKCYGRKGCLAVETDQLTWRGLEGLINQQDGDNASAKKEERVAFHIHSVLDEVNKAKQDPEAIRQIAHKLSRPDTHRALERAAKDAEASRFLSCDDKPTNKKGKPKTVIGKLKRIISLRKIAAVRI